nr:flavodoxin family protein [Lachnospiraceae bacterium]
MRNICLLLGSPRKGGNTWQLARVFKEEAEQLGCKVTQFDLIDMDLRPCLACRTCQQDWADFGCPQDDDMGRIFRAVLACDVLVLATPIYSWYCTPPMKAVLDRLVYGMNKYYGTEKGPALWAGKELALITTCGYPPDKGADLWTEGMKRYAKHSQLLYRGMLAERHLGYDTEFMDHGKEIRAALFAREICTKWGV